MANFEDRIIALENDMKQQGICLSARITALDLLVRILFTKIASETDNPEDAIFTIIEQTVASAINNVGEIQGEEAVYVAEMEGFLRKFGKNVSLRLSLQPG